MDDRRHDVVQERPVVRHQQDGAVEIQQLLFEQLQRLRVEVVGRLVQHQDVGRFGHQLRQQDSVAFAAGEEFDFGPGAFRGEQKILQVAVDVLFRVADPDAFGALGDVVGDGPFRVERVALLIEIRHFLPGPDPHGSIVGRQRTEDQLQQRTLSGPVRTDDPDAVAAGDRQIERPEDGFVVERLGDVLEFGDQLSAGFAALKVQLRGAGSLSSVGRLDPHRLESFHSTFVASPSGLNALTNPGLFLGQSFGEQGVLLFLGFQGVGLPFEERVVVARPIEQTAPVEFPDADGQ